MTLKLVGVDPFAEGRFRKYTPSIDSQVDLGRFLTEPGASLMTEQTAASLGLDIGDRLSLVVNGNSYATTIIGFLRAPEQVTLTALANLIVLDISSAQEMLSQHGRLSRIDLIIPDDRDEADSLRQLRSLLPGAAEIIPANSRAKTMAQMTRAFQLNLTALSLLALVVGMFIIYNLSLIHI